MIDVLTVGEILIDLIATQENSTLFDAVAFQPAPGGAPVNVAVGVARLGKSAGFVGKVGDDDFGQGMRSLLDHEGVNTKGLVSDATTLTTLSLVALATGGEPHFAFAAGAHTRLTTAEIPMDLIRAARIVYVGSVSLAHEPVGAATLATIDQARAAGATIAYDVNWRPFLYRAMPLTRALEIVRLPLAAADVVKLNLAELRLLTDTTTLADGIARLATMTAAPLVIVTLGARGCAAYLHGHLTEMAAPPVDRVVDATGAGDAFFATVLAALPAKLAELDAPMLHILLQRAVAAGSLAVTKRGAIPSLPTAAELDAFLAQGGTTP